MAFVYRYIDLKKEETIYIGKVKSSVSCGLEPLEQRHAQHKREKWYKDNENSIIMQFVELDSHTDADILETWLINFYDTGQLINISKTGWGKSKLWLYEAVFGRWRTYGQGCNQKQRRIEGAVKTLERMTEGYRFNIDVGIAQFTATLHEIVADDNKANLLSRYNLQDDFKRCKHEMA